MTLCMGIEVNVSSLLLIKIFTVNEKWEVDNNDIFYGINLMFISR